MKEKKKEQKGAEARWEKNQEGELEGIIHLGKNRSQGKTETRWSKKEESESPKNSKGAKKTESRWESDLNQ